MRFLRAVVFTAMGCMLAAADSVKPFHYGPYVMNQVALIASPIGYDYTLTNGFYHFQIGWIEPMSETRNGIFQGTYFETDGTMKVSPYYVNLGTTFNLKPIRYLETGITYNRLLYNKSMITFGSSPTLKEWAPKAIMTVDKEAGGADIFTIQANLTFDIRRLQLFLYASHSQWDVDAAGKNFVYEYVDDILIKPRDRVDLGLAQLFLDLRPMSVSKYFSCTGLAIRDHYWYAEKTELEKNLVSGGVTGFRLGHDSERQKRGLDFSLGYWTRHPQIPEHASASNRWVIVTDWKWNVQVLNL